MKPLVYNNKTLTNFSKMYYLYISFNNFGMCVINFSCLVVHVLFLTLQSIMVCAKIKFAFHFVGNKMKIEMEQNGNQQMY